MVYQDLEKRRLWQRQYYAAHKKRKSVRQLLMEENERLKKEIEQLRKQNVLLICPKCLK